MHHPAFLDGAGLYVEVRIAVGMSSRSSALYRIGAPHREVQGVQGVRGFKEQNPRAGVLDVASILRFGLYRLILVLLELPFPRP